MRNFDLENFQGPLDLLLQLIEARKLEITTVSLADVAEQFLEYLEKVEERQPDELADFLVIATKLLLLKSQALLPYLHLEEEEDPGELAAQLRMYKKYVDAMQFVEQRLLADQVLYAKKDGKLLIDIGFSPPPSVGGADLRATFIDILGRLEPVVRIPKAAIAKVMSLREKFSQIQELLTKQVRLRFSELLADSADRGEVVVTFLALLELIKKQSISVKQDGHLTEIVIEKI